MTQTTKFMAETELTADNCMKNALGYQPKKLWLWRNFIDGKPEYLAYDNPYPCHPNGDPMTLGEPCGYAIEKDSINGRPDRTEEYAISQIKVPLEHEQRTKGSGGKE